MAATIAPTRLDDPETGTRPPSLDDPEPRPTPRAPARRPTSAPRVLVTMIVCLGAWAVLFGPALERGARTSPVGARRTVALAVLRPITAVSDTLAVGGVSEAVLRALGRDPGEPPGGELVLPDLDLPPLVPAGPADGSAASAPPVAVAPSASPPAADEAPVRPPPTAAASPSPEPDPDPVAIRTPTPRDRLRVAIVGDSLSQGLGPSVAQLFDPGLSRVLPLGRQSTGLARLDYFNWRAAMRRIAVEVRPDLVFVMLGSNDQQSQVAPDGGEIRVGSVEWVRGYRERATAFLREATSAGARVVWVGIPVVAERERWDFYRRVNAIYEEVARADPLATYLDAWALFEARDGGYSAYLRNAQGTVQLVRAGDGIHFTPTGYTYLARAAIRAAAEAFALPAESVVFRI